ncbi:MAG: Rieske (2Fe-2S) protein [Frankiaceae bacterium]|nr:Rieske (2Fe-2S) protein [Frankiaceae bacterium]MBV9871443.1 Rieske (2Fe-2S) protein [Frankiaceae bacterium]
MSGDGSDRPRRQVGRRPDEAPDVPQAGLPASHSEGVVEDHADDPREVQFSEIQVAALFGVGIVAIIFFLYAYFGISIHDNLGQYSNYALGGSLAIALCAIGAGFIVWAKKLLPHEKTVQDRHDFHSPPEEEKLAEDTFLQGVEDMGLARFKILRRTLLGALALFPLPIVVLLRDLGPLPGRSLEGDGEITGWKAGSRLVDLDTKLPVKLGDLSIGGVQTVMPEGFGSAEELSLAPTMLIRFAPGEIKSDKERNWGINGHVAYSKICTHAGCPISLYEQQTHNLLCPCHQSTFDMANDAKVIFGPAARPLPQLQISADRDGYLYAVKPYSQPVGPSFWERR